MKKLLGVALAIAMYSLSFAQTETLPSVQNPVSRAQPQEAGQSIPQEIIELRAQNRLIREYHSSLLDTVYYALGGLGGVALLLVGLNWFSSARLRVADKEQISQEFTSKASALEAKMGGALSEMQTATLTAVDTRVDALLGRISADLLGLRGEISAEILEFRKALTEVEKVNARS